MLLTGSELYKKHSKHASLKQRAFDPLNSSVSPELCSYGIRQIRVSRNLQRIEVRLAFRPKVEATFSVEQVIGPVIPRLTMTILKVQKRLGKPSVQTCRDFIEDVVEEDEKLYNDMRDRGLLSENSEVFQKLCKDCTYYPFSISMANGGRLELIARNYQSFQMWVNGINALVKNRRSIPRLVAKIEALAN